MAGLSSIGPHAFTSLVLEDVLVECMQKIKDISQRKNSIFRPRKLTPNYINDSRYTVHFLQMTLTGIVSGSFSTCTVLRSACFTVCETNSAKKKKQL